MNPAYIHYAYPTSETATALGKRETGCYFVRIGGITSPGYVTLDGAEGWARNNGIVFKYGSGVANGKIRQELARRNRSIHHHQTAGV